MMQMTVVNNMDQVGVPLRQGSLLKGVFKDQQASFIELLGQLAEGKEIEISGQKISMEDNMLGATMALNKWLSENEALNTYLWKVFNFEQKMMDQVASMTA